MVGFTWSNVCAYQQLLEYNYLVCGLSVKLLLHSANPLFDITILGIYTDYEGHLSSDCREYHAALLERFL